MREAGVVGALAQSLETALAHRDFSPGDLSALAEDLTAAGRDGDATTYSGAEQATMALGAIASNLQMAGALDPARVRAVNAAIGGLDKILADEEAYRPDAFVKALEAVQQALPLKR